MSGTRECGGPGGTRLMCDDPEDCPNGPEEHEFVHPDDALMCCVKQQWEEDS